MARTRKFSQKQMIEALTRFNGLVTPAARYLACDPSTVEDYIASFPAVAAAKKQQREAMLDLGEAALISAVRRGEGWAIAFLLKTIGKERGYVERIDQRIELEVYVKQRAQELGLTEEEALEVAKPRMLKAG